MAAKLTFRTATEADVPKLLDFHAELDPEMTRLPAEKALEMFRRTLRYPSYTHYLVFDGEACVGTFALLILENLAHCGAPFAVIENVVVDRAHRQKGVGRAMMAHALDLARRAGCYKLSLSTNARRTEAHAFYEHLGFQRHGYSYVASL